MKKVLLALSLITSLFINAQDNWQMIEGNGVNYNSTLWRSVMFQNKHYVMGDTNGTCIVFSSSTGTPGSYTEVPGLGAVMQTMNESYLTSAVVDNNNIFMGSQTWYDTVSGGGSNRPQVYRYDGSAFSKHGNLPFVPAQNYIYASVGAIALYSPTGSNDTVYAFTQSSTGDFVSVWKAPAFQANPTWDSLTTFSASGINAVYDAKVWHKKLYVAVGGGPSGPMILRTANGVVWDTVATGASLMPALGLNSYNNKITSFEIYRDTLIAAAAPGYSSGNGVGLIYTADSLATVQNWNALIDSAHFNNLASTWSYVTDMQVVGPNLYISANVNSYYSPSTFMVTNNAAGRDTILTSSSGTVVNSYNNSGADLFLGAIGTHVLVTTHYTMASRPSGNHTQGVSMGTPGEIYTFNMVNPTAAFTYSVSPGTGYCENQTIYLTNTTVNGASYEWYINGAHYSWAQDTTFSENTAGVYTVELVAYNGTYQSIWKDSTTQTITIFQNPMVMTSASSYTVCQGEPDSLYVNTVGGTGPFTYTWNNVNDNITYPGSPNDTTIIQLYTVPSFSPYVYTYIDIHDANMCTPSNPPPPLYIYVNNADSLSGTIIDTLLNPVVAGQVYLFRLNPLNPQPGDTAGTFTLGAGGAYYFPAVLYGSYVAKAVADTSNPLYKTAVGTYYSNKTYPFQWDSALVIQHHTCVNGNVGGNDIKILQMPPPLTGPGSISGQITYDSSYTGARLAHGGGFIPLGAPLKGVDVKLGKNPGGSPAARTTTDTSGNFSFNNIPLGSYSIYVDIPNYGMAAVRSVTLTSTTPNSPSNDYYVDSSMIRTIPVTNVAAAICQGDSILAGGGYQMAGGVYNDTINSNGHDSLVITTLTVKPLPTLTVTTTADTICLGGSGAVLTVAGNSTAYLWSGNAGSVTTSTVSVNPTVNTTYTVTGTLNGCSASQTILIVAKNCAGIQSFSQSGFDVYPNPAVDKVNVQSDKAGSVRLINIAGQVVLEQKIQAGKNEINVSSLPAGVYGLSRTAAGQTNSVRLLITK